MGKRPRAGRTTIFCAVSANQPDHSTAVVGNGVPDEDDFEQEINYKPVGRMALGRLVCCEDDAAREGCGRGAVVEGLGRRRWSSSHVEQLEEVALVVVVDAHDTHDEATTDAPTWIAEDLGLLRQVVETKLQEAEHLAADRHGDYACGLHSQGHGAGPFA